MKHHSFFSTARTFLVLWSGTTISSLGSAMTSFALLLWAYQQHGTATSGTLMAFFTYGPSVLVSFMAGTVVEKLDKRRVLLVTSAIATAGTVALLAIPGAGALRVWILYALNLVMAVVSAFRAPAVNVVTSVLVPPQHYPRASGLQSLADALRTMAAPVLATMVYAIGGLAVTVRQPSRGRADVALLACAVSFAVGDTLMGVGRTPAVWVAGMLGSYLPLPLLNAHLTTIMRTIIPIPMQARVFSARDTLQFSTIPVGLLLAGPLADCVFEPMMRGHTWLSSFLSVVVGTGPGSGMAVMFVITAVVGTVASLVAWWRVRGGARSDPPDRPDELA